MAEATSAPIRSGVRATGGSSIYARASTEAKRKALEAIYADVVTADLAEWNQDPELLNWLASL
jgi:integrase/recombinase XerD